MSSTVKDYLFLNNQRVATLNNGSTLFFTIGDHLGSSDIITDSSGAATEYADYKPYGNQALAQVPTDTKNTRTFTDKELDAETALQYFGARYLSNNLARFHSIDPVLLSFQDSDKFKAQAGRNIPAFITNPQELNSYAYTANNPLRYVDPDGNTLWQVITGQQSLSNYRIEIGQAAEVLHQTSPTWKTVLDHPIASSVAIGVGGALAASGIAAGATWALTELGAIGATQIPAAVQKTEDYTQKYGPTLGEKMNQVASNLKGSPYKFTTHSIQRIAEKVGVGNESSVINVLQNSKSFEYLHEGIVKLGYYDNLTRIFVGQIKNSQNITTVITNVTESYIKNLLK